MVTTLLSILVGLAVSILLVFLDWMWGSRWVARVLWWRSIEIRVVGANEEPLQGGTVIVSGWGVHTTNEAGNVKIYIPRHDAYGLQVKTLTSAAGHYNLVMKPGHRYEYRVGGSTQLRNLGPREVPPRCWVQALLRGRGRRG